MEIRRDELDRYITGNYGEDQSGREGETMGPECEVCGEDLKTPEEKEDNVCEHCQLELDEAAVSEEEDDGDQN